MNTTDLDVVVVKDKSKCWYDKDFSTKMIIPANGSKTFTTEDKASGGCYDDGAGITHDHYIKLKVIDAFNLQSDFKLHTDYSAGWKAHCKGPDTGKNIDGKRSSCSYTITINSFAIQPHFKINSIGLGDISSTPLNRDQSKIQLNFSRVATACYILLDQDGYANELSCSDSDVGFKNKGTHIDFLCQQVDHNDSQCPYILKNIPKNSSSYYFS
ncbi:hypothetical protein L3V82_00210 [Thiotrichales bacterium 19S3-7]|nr:hypothetical protein [Thiotrichales bacterium 19S3-7]MCF6800586.1 hypothetical protein [Thiotrichales bacterium 19S3-11]